MFDIKKNSKILFQGDSVTDCHRDRSNINSLGNSYVKNISEYLKQYNITCINKGIAGNKINDLLDRFDNDFKNIKPDYIFLLIGVNDTWHNFPNQKDTNTFEKEYDLLLTKIKAEINVPIILLEPFIIGYDNEIIVMKDDLYQKIESIKKLKNKHNCYYISFENEFNKALTKDNYLEYTIEGIHPLEKGYEIMTKVLIDNINIL